MGRERWKYKDLPPRMKRRELVKSVRFYYCHANGKRTPLGGDYLTALEKYVDIERSPAASVPTLRTELTAFSVSDRFKDLAQGTQYHYTRAIARLTTVFGACHYDQIGKADLNTYVKRSSAKTLAKRDIACLSSCWSWALAEGRTTVANPRFGLEFRRKRAERKAGRYVTHDEFQAVRERGDAILQDAMDLLYLSGQDVRVVLSWRRDHIHWDEAVLDTTRTKTGRPMRIELRNADGTLTEFAVAIKRALERPRLAQSLHIVSDDRGQRVTYMRLWNRFVKARKAAGVDFELRQIRPKTASDSDDLLRAQELLGHEDSRMTRRHYRRGEKVRPLK